MSKTKTSAPVVSRNGDAIDIEWDIQIGAFTAWESVRLERTADGDLLISGRDSGPTEIPIENVGLIMSLVAELIPEAVAK